MRARLGRVRMVARGLIQNKCYIGLHAVQLNASDVLFYAIMNSIAGRLFLERVHRVETHQARAGHEYREYI